MKFPHVVKNRSCDVRVDHVVDGFGRRGENEGMGDLVEIVWELGWELGWEIETLREAAWNARMKLIVGMICLMTRKVRRGP